MHGKNVILKVHSLIFKSDKNTFDKGRVILTQTHSYMRYQKKGEISKFWTYTVVPSNNSSN